MHLANLPLAEAFKSLGTSELGLTPAEAARRLGEYGPNHIAEIGVEAPWRCFLREFTHFFAVILWIAAGLAFYAESRTHGEGMWQLGVAIIAVILINGCFSYWQEYRAERAIDALRKLLPQSVKVVRDGQLMTLPGEELVPGDLILLEAGDNVPADCRLIFANGIRVNASTITGESLPKARSAEECTEHSAEQSALETKNVLLAGTSLVSGEGRAIVFATGMASEFGKIAHLTQTADKTISHLQIEIARLSRLVAIFATTLGAVFFALGAVLGLPFWANLMFAIGIIVANVPEGLLPTVTLSLAMATQRMARRNALIRHLPAVETLGSTTVICSDKTGTLTQNRMSVRQVFWNDCLDDTGNEVALAIERGGIAHLLRNAACCHSLKQENRDGKTLWLGDPMEVALQEFASRATSNGLHVIGEIAFDSDRRRMSVIVEQGSERWLYCKGAPEVVMPLCKEIELDGRVLAFDKHSRHHASEAQQRMADSGLRVLAFACRRLDDDTGDTGDTNSADALEENLTFSGLIGLYDPPRPEVPEAIARCRTAGIKVVMVTGDHPHTAAAIAREIGLVQGTNPRVILGSSLRKMTPAQLQIALDSPEVLFARVTAEQKMLVVNAFKKKGEIVAVTGDGVNDAPALRTAHIGIAMGLNGTDVAKSAADMILLDDNFASIVNAIEEGRAVFENIRKFLTYILTSNIPELIPYLVYVLLRVPLPLTIIQILAVDLGTDMVPALALGAERPDPEVMRQPPRRPEERLLSWPLIIRAYLWLGPLQAAISLAAFFFVLHAGGWHYGEQLAMHTPLYLQATTACLAAIVAGQVINVFLCRHPRVAAWSFPIAGNRLLLLGIAVECSLLMFIVFTLPGNWLFATQAFPASAWGVIAGLVLVFGSLEEIRKFAARRFRKV